MPRTGQESKNMLSRKLCNYCINKNMKIDI